MSTLRSLSGDALPVPAGLAASSLKLLEFRGDGGIYHARMHWRIEPA